MLQPIYSIGWYHFLPKRFFIFKNCIKNSASVFSFSQHYFYGVNLPNGQQIVYYEEDETNKGEKQGVFLFLKEKHLCLSL